MQLRFAFFAVLLLLLGGCFASQPLPYVDLEDLDPTLAAGAQNISPRPVIRLAASVDLSPQESLLRYGPVFDYIGRRLNRHVEIIVPKSYSEAVDQVRSGGVHMAWVGSYAYVRGQSEFGMEALAAPATDEGPQHRAYVLVRRYSSLTQFSHLKGHTFAYTDPWSASGRLYPELLVTNLNESVDRFFEHAIFTSGFDHAIAALDQGVVDGASVDAASYDMLVKRDPDLQRRVRILEASEPWGTPPLVVSPELPVGLKEQLREVLLTMHEDPEGAKVLADLAIDRFVLPDDSLYDPVRDLAERLGMMP